METITVENLIKKLSLYGLNELAEEVTTANCVAISDYDHFAVYDEDGYGNDYIIEGTDEVTAVYGRLVEPEGGTVWGFRDNPDWEVPVPDNAKVEEAIENTIKLDGDKVADVPEHYWENTLAQRCPGPKAKGSIFDGLTPEQLESYIRSANWEKAENQNVWNICQAYKTTDIPGGLYGVVPLDDLPDTISLIVLDTKSTGFVSLCVEGGLRVPTEETWLIVGPTATGEKVVFTLHPGVPSPRPTTPTEALPVGTRLTKAEAIALGFNSANVL